MMKHYLELVPVSARVHKKQNRMTLLCISLAVFLVTVIFGMADMELRSQKIRTVQTDGAWHAAFKALSREQAGLIAARPQVEVSSWYGVLNYGLDMGYFLNGSETAICGFDESFLKLFPASKLVEGTWPSGENEAIVTKSVREQLGIRLGDRISLDTPEGRCLSFTVTGFTGDTSMLTDKDAFGIFLNMDTYLKSFSGSILPEDLAYYVAFSPRCRIERVISDIQTRLGLADSQVGKNALLLGVTGQSSDSYMNALYGVAFILAILVITAGILMISSSLNSNVARRTQFFGLLRCLGSTRKQIIRFVRAEALSWCKIAIPLGLIAGTLVVWALCAMLRFLSPSLFGEMPAFDVSWIALVSGAVIGIVTVLLASRAPARKASRVSPLTAVSGNDSTVQFAKRAARTRLFRVETALGVHHAGSSKKNLILLTCSFAFSIILFLSFTSAVDFMNHAITPLRPYTPDLSIISPDNTCSVSPEILEQIQSNPAVKRVYGRMFSYNVPAVIDGQEKPVTLVSYEEHQFGWARDKILEGAIEEVQSGTGVLGVHDPGCVLQTGSVIALDLGAGPQQLEVKGILSDQPMSPIPGVETLFCSEKLFTQLTGAAGYTILDIQLKSGATDEDVAALRALAGKDTVFSDRRLKNNEVRGASYSMSLFIYGFLAIIALISIFNIINSIAMSVSARLNTYGAMRAIGMSDRQVIKMIAAEALTYVACGVVLGCAAGLPLNRLLYTSLVTSRWGTPWYVPAASLCTIILIVAAASVLAVSGPAKRIRGMSVTDTINAQ